MTDEPKQIAIREEAQPPVTPGAMLDAFMQLARDPAVRPEVLTTLAGMQERAEDRQAEREFNRAFIRLRAKLPRLKKNGTLEYPVDKNRPDGPKRKISNFVKYEDLDAAIGPLLNEEGFAISFNTTPRAGDGGGLLVTAILRHEGGHKTETTIPVPLDSSGGKNNLQGYGSTLSYGKRYAATAALNLVAEGEDDDGVRGGMEFITPSQVDEIDSMLDQAGGDRDRFLQTLGHTDVGNILAGEFAIVKNILLQRIAARKQKAPSA